jgi:hypothetical protein
VTGNDRKEMFNVLSEVYHQYLIVYRKMDEVDDQIAHPQKHIVTRNLLELIVVRLLEIRAALVMTENSEYFYFDELAYTEKIPPPEFDIAIPSFYYHDPPAFVKFKETWFDLIAERKAKAEAKRIQEQLRLEAMMRAEKGWEDEEPEQTEPEEEFTQEDQEDVIVVQCMERARQGKNRFIIARYLYEEEMKVYKKAKPKPQKPLMDMEQAVIIIQV